MKNFQNLQFKMTFGGERCLSKPDIGNLQLSAFLSCISETLSKVFQKHFTPHITTINTLTYF